MIKALSIPVVGRPSLVQIPVGDLGAVYAYTSGPYIEAVYHPTGAVIFLNEEGIQKQLPLNPIATAVVHEAGALVYGPGVLGDALVVGPPDAEGNETDVPEELVVVVQARADLAAQAQT